MSSLSDENERRIKEITETVDPYGAFTVELDTIRYLYKNKIFLSDPNTMILYHHIRDTKPVREAYRDFFIKKNLPSDEAEQLMDGPLKGLIEDFVKKLNPMYGGRKSRRNKSRRNKSRRNKSRRRK